MCIVLTAKLSFANGWGTADPHLRENSALQSAKEVFPVRYIMQSSQKDVNLLNSFCWKLWLILFLCRMSLICIWISCATHTQLLWHGWVLAHKHCVLLGDWGRICTKTVGWDTAIVVISKQVTAPCNHLIQDRYTIVVISKQVTASFHSC